MTKLTYTHKIIPPNGKIKQPTRLNIEIELNTPTTFSKLTEKLEIGNIEFETGFAAHRGLHLIGVIEKKDPFWMIWPIKAGEIQVSLGCRDLTNAKEFVTRFL
jgi:hypothetical protein